MKPLSILAPWSGDPSFLETLRDLAEINAVEHLFVLTEEQVSEGIPQKSTLLSGRLSSGESLAGALSRVDTDYLLIVPEARPLKIVPDAFARLLDSACSTGSGMVYSDYRVEGETGAIPHPVNDYQAGSVRDDFDFGPLMLFSNEAVRKALSEHGSLPPVMHAALYDLRLKVSCSHALRRLPEPLCTAGAPRQAEKGEAIFDYVDRRNEQAQKELEVVFTEHLKRIGAYLPPSSLRYGTSADPQDGVFPVVASVIIPVRNRRATIADAVRSALSQEAAFPFNVIVVDNHSTDGTTEVLAGLAGRRPALRHIIPARTDLAIGGCWNEALSSPFCGRYAVQLDSDDLYSSPSSLKTIIDLISSGFAMVVGSYELVNFDLEPVPPGLIDHREWTDNNGHNNALRINGLGAPRAFDTALMRSVGFPNVSYGEDYAAALRISRQYRIGRIFESLYLCRRWPGNTDAALSVEAANRNNAFKDSIRTSEIEARQELNRERGQR